MDLALRTAVILAVAWTFARLLSRATAATRHLVWHLAIVAVLAAPLLTPLAPKFRVPQVPEALTVPDVRLLEALREGPRKLHDTRTSGTASIPGTASTLSTPGTPGTLGTLGTLIWPAGSAAFALWFACGWLLTAVSVRRAKPTAASWQVEVNALCKRLRITREITVRVVARDVSPVVTGLWRTTIVLPEAARGWDSDRRYSVLLHELAHIRRGDLHVQALAHAACALYWFNPLVWIAAAHLRTERERACDDEVLRSGAQASTYASHLLDIARELRPTLRRSAALAMARPSELEGRLLAVLAAGRPRVPARPTRWAIASMATALSMAVLGATPPTISTHAENATPTAVQRSEPSATWVASMDAPTAAERIATDRVVRQAVQALESPDAQARERAVMDLAAAGQVNSIQPLEVALADPDQDVREKAALGLALMSSPDAIPGLLKALSDPDGQVREKAAIGLALRRDAAVVEALLVAMDDPDAQVREKVAIALGTSGDPRAAGALERALEDPDSQVREKAVTGLEMLRSNVIQPAQGDQARAGLRGLLGALLSAAR